MVTKISVSVVRNTGLQSQYHIKKAIAQFILQLIITIVSVVNTTQPKANLIFKVISVLIWYVYACHLITKFKTDCSLSTRGQWQSHRTKLLFEFWFKECIGIYVSLNLANKNKICFVKQCETFWAESFVPSTISGG